MECLLLYAFMNYCYMLMTLKYMQQLIPLIIGVRVKKEIKLYHLISLYNLVRNHIDCSDLIFKLSYHLPSPMIRSENSSFLYRQRAKSNIIRKSPTWRMSTSNNHVSKAIKDIDICNVTFVISFFSLTIIQKILMICMHCYWAFIAVVFNYQAIPRLAFMIIIIIINSHI